MTTEKKKKRTGRAAQFPTRLHDLMKFVEETGLESVISWELNGQGIKIHHPEILVQQLLPLFFDQTKYRSFRRQLNMWHFHRISEGPNKGIFVHPYFVKHNRALSSLMSRQVDLKAGSQFSDSPTNVPSSTSEAAGAPNSDTESSPAATSNFDLEAIFSHATMKTGASDIVSLPNTDIEPTPSKIDLMRPLGQFFSSPATLSSSAHAAAGLPTTYKSEPTVDLKPVAQFFTSQNTLPSAPQIVRLPNPPSKTDLKPFAQAFANPTLSESIDLEPFCFPNNDRTEPTPLQDDLKPMGHFYSSPTSSSCSSNDAARVPQL